VKKQKAAGNLINNSFHYPEHIHDDDDNDDDARINLREGDTVKPCVRHLDIKCPFGLEGKNHKAAGSLINN
jgi:hypothetical protein